MCEERVRLSSECRDGMPAAAASDFNKLQLRLYMVLTRSWGSRLRGPNKRSRGGMRDGPSAHSCLACRGPGCTLAASDTSLGGCPCL